MASLASINVKFSTDLAGFQSEMQKAQKSIEKYSAKMRQVGAQFSTYVTAPIVAGVTAIVKGTEELRADLGRLETNAKMAGQEIGFMRDQLKSVAAITGETDSSIEGLSNLLSAGFRDNQLEEVMNNLSGAAVKFSDTMKFEGMADGLQETLATGKAIGPFAELLERSGVNLEVFDAGLKSAIRNGTQHNYVLDTLAKTGLANVNEKYREHNKNLIEAREAEMAFQMAVADLGNMFQPIFTMATELVTDLVNKFLALSPETQNWIMILGGIAAAIGPIMVLVGTALPALIAGFTALTGPVGIVVAALVAITAVVIANWDKMSDYVIQLARDFVRLYNESETFRIVIHAIIMHFKNLWVVGKALFKGLIAVVAEFADVFVERFKMIFRIFDQIKEGNFGEAFSLFKDASFGLNKQAFENIVSEGTSIIEGAMKDIAGNVETFKIGIKTQIDEEKFINSFKNGLGKIKGAIEDFNSGEGTDVYGMVTPGAGLATGSGSGNSAVQMSGIKMNPAGFRSMEIILEFPEKMEAQLPYLMTALQKWKLQMMDFNEEMAKMTSAFVSDMVSSFAEAIAGLASGTTNMRSILMGMLGMMADFVSKYGKMLITYGVGVVAFESSFTNPYAAIAAGAALVALGALMKNMMATPKLASGGIAYGETLATIGEYRGAKSNPEVIAPLNKLKSLLGTGDGGGMPQTVHLVAHGNELIGTIDRQTYINNKIS